MAKETVIIPQSVEDRMKAQRGGIAKSRMLRDYLSPLIRDGLEIKGFSRDQDGRLHVEVDTFTPDPAEIPDEWKRKPRK